MGSNEFEVALVDPPKTFHLLTDIILSNPSPATTCARIHHAEEDETPLAAKRRTSSIAVSSIDTVVISLASAKGLAPDRGVLAQSRMGGITEPNYSIRGSFTKLSSE